MTGHQPSHGATATPRTIFFEVFELNNPRAEPFGVIMADVTKRSGDGVEGTVVSLHWTRAEAEAAARAHSESRGTGS